MSGNKILEEASVSGLSKGAWTETKESIDTVSMIDSIELGNGYWNIILI